MTTVDEAIKEMRKRIENECLHKGYKLNPELKTGYRKFFAYKMRESEGHSFSVLSAIRVLNNFLKESNLINRKLEFNLTNLETLKDIEDFDYLVRGLIYFKELPKTNFDKIKAMSVDEMASVIADSCLHCKHLEKDGLCNSHCREGIKQWLEQECKQ